ncbi:hypothetical protein [Streptomyces brasiliensis]|uniref:Enolase n=1 Tax=Streptomyces brasiliensis TaxID=1954 RepID=A0A917UNX7_9ACTN|nr:hypothetical protein [Streptomyces brasiliensis]GGJ71807.1 hypothetical protein GCM10010121_098020 [Streptomyces brasiliensis]
MSKRFQVSNLHAVEILDSRARPTLAVTLTTTDGTRVRACVPAGVSTGTREAVELRDSDQTRYNGQGVLTAIGHINGEIVQALTGRTFASAAELDRALLGLDGTETKSRLGTNAVIGVSPAVIRAEAALAGRELWQHPAQIAGTTPRLPVPHFHVVNGGAHAVNNLDFQEFMPAPLGAPSLPEALRAETEVYARLKARLAALGQPTGLGDEGGFAPAIDRPEDVLKLIVDAITDVGYTAGRDGVAIWTQPPASSAALTAFITSRVPPSRATSSSIAPACYAVDTRSSGDYSCRQVHRVPASRGERAPVPGAHWPPRSSPNHEDASGRCSHVCWSRRPLRWHSFLRGRRLRSVE